MEKIKTIPDWKLEKVKSRKEVILEAQRYKNKVPLCVIDGQMSSQKNRGVGTTISEVQGQES